MHIKINYDWENYDYNCSAYPEKKELISLKLASLDSDISLFQIDEKKLYLVELWGGSGPSMNSFDITDDKKKAFECFKEYLELCVDMLIDEKYDKDKILLEAREKLGLISQKPT